MNRKTQERGQKRGKGQNYESEISRVLEAEEREGSRQGSQPDPAPRAPAERDLAQLFSGVQSVLWRLFLFLL